MERFINILKAADTDGWQITDKKIRGWEFYFIRHRLDQNRAKDIEKISIKVFKKIDGGESLGFAVADVAPTASDEEIKKTVEDLIFQASLVKNKPFKLVQPKAFEPLTSEVSPVREEAGRFINAMNSVPETATEDLNSYEIFTNVVERRVVNSEGVDVTERYNDSMLDVVINARNDEREIELYRLWDLGACDGEAVKRDVCEVLRFGKDRLSAVPTPQFEDIPVILSTQDAVQVYGYFVDNLETSAVVRGMSPLKLGQPICEDVTGDKLTINALRCLEKSPQNISCDEEGSPIRDMSLIKDHVPQNYFGYRMFSQYLGLEDSFDVSNWAVTGGSRSAKELRSGRYLELVEFSAFEVDEDTGDIFGEIRLGYYCDGEKITPVTGGSVSGNILDNLADMRFSSETRQFSNVVIPSVTRLSHVTIAGAAKE